jgi:hypothetical protein
MFALAAVLPAADCTLELRGSSIAYRYTDVLCNLTPHWVAEGYYIGAPGANEANIGFGYQIKPKPSLTFIPVVYATGGKENGQRGGKLALIFGWEKGKYKTAGYLARYQRFAGVGDQLHGIRYARRHSSGIQTLGSRHLYGILGARTRVEPAVRPGRQNQRQAWIHRRFLSLRRQGTSGITSIRYQALGGTHYSPIFPDLD